ncbi:MAG: Ig-like domain-containing protein [Gallionellaceae bacterium]|nr:Ig-like domain-containing protein [Gallionellaceae bacterium]
MQSSTRRIPAAAFLALLSALAQAGVVTPELEQEIATRSPAEAIPVIIQFADRVNVRKFEVRDRHRRDNRLVSALRDKADRVQRPFAAQFARYGARNTRQLWLINGIAATVPAGAISQLARFPAIGRIQYDATVPLAQTTPSAPTNATWNLAAIHVPEVWALGDTGAGVVVASMDTGVDPNHPDLAGKWRGGGNSWFDPYGQHALPHDFSGHGTQTMGLMVGGAASGNSIGVAPDARWIAAKIFDDSGHATLSNIHLAFQWLLDPDGNAATLDAPDVVNASWGLTGAATGSCDLEFNGDVATLKAAGIAVVFAAGNDGPADASSVSPANNPSGYSAGAVDSALAIASQSSRGPSGCDSSVFPRLAAPGVNVVTSDLSFGGFPVYAMVSGTSFAAPHIAGAMALLARDFPSASVADLEDALTSTAQDLGPTGADNSYGYGLANVAAAHDLLAAGSGAGSPPAFASTPPTSAVAGQPYSYQAVASDPDGDVVSFALVTAPAGMTIDSTGGLIAWTPGPAQTGANAVTVQATDPTGLSATQSFSISVVAGNHAPVAGNDSYGVVAGSTLNVAAPGVLANDSDPDGNPVSAVLVSGPAHGSLSLNGNGGFSYQPAAGYSGGDAFSYQASDGQLNSATANVSISISAAVNQPPVAANDSYTAPNYSGKNYTAQVYNILANDRDPDGSLAVGTVAISSAPNKGGSVTVNGNGSVTYVPKKRFTGTETFKYTVRDNLGALSNAATVSVRVR